MKKKLGLPFHPNSKKEEFYSHIESKKFIIRNNKSEINIPYNKNNNKSCRLRRDNSSFDNFGIHKSIRNIKEKNDSFFDIYSSKNIDNINQYENSNLLIETFQSRNNKNFVLIKDEDEDIGVEMAHFRIITIIQENKRLLNKEDK